ncbi:hypothetical protein GCM10027346_28520 [Hymenobacter seoulensis]
MLGNDTIQSQMGQKLRAEAAASTATTAAHTAALGPIGPTEKGSGNYETGTTAEAKVHGLLFLYGQELAPFRLLRMVADAS